MSVKDFVPIDNSKPASFWGRLIDAHTAPGDAVLVPFADNLDVARAALVQDRRIVLLVRTPAQRLRLLGRLTPPAEADQRRALSELARTTKRDTPLDRYLKDLYATTCPDCGQTTSALAFIWDQGRGSPVEKELTCEDCDFQGRAPADEADVKRAKQFEGHGLSFWFLLERLVDPQDASEREIVRRRLGAYSSRNLTALADVTRKIDAELSDDPKVQHVLRLNLLYALDAGRRLPDPLDGSRAIERNVWHLLTHPPAAETFESSIGLAPMLEDFFAGADPPPNVALDAGPVRRLARQLPSAHFRLILGAPPRLDTDDWVWEQLWSRWVVGRETAGQLQPPVGGWTRHVRALSVTLGDLMPALRPDGRVIFRFTTDDVDRAAATLIALAPHATLVDFAFQPPLVEPANLFSLAGGLYYLTCLPDPSPARPAIDPPTLARSIETEAVEAATDVIQLRAEPLPYDWVFAAVLVRLAQAERLRRAMTGVDTNASPLAFVKQHVRQGLRSALAEEELTAIGEDETAHWWLPESPLTEPLSERVERTLTAWLSDGKSVSVADVYREFAGWLTPEAALVTALLTAYGEETEPGVWVLRTSTGDEKGTILDAVRRLGEWLAFAVGAGIGDVVWGEGGHATHVFSILETGEWRNIATETVPSTAAGYLVLPDRLIDLLRVKLLRNPLWRRELVDGRWRLIKARHLLALADAPDIDRQTFKKIVGLDPIIEQAEAQIPLFEP